MKAKTLFLLCLVAAPVLAQQPPAVAPAARTPTPEEVAFSRLPADLRRMLGHMTAPQALQTIRHSQENLRALGIPQPTHQQLRTNLEFVLTGPFGPVPSYSAGAAPFPPLSPLVPPPAR
ncbi:MAG TPA: hypothetical protein VM489_04095 [Burkholderiales bacterium]|nr:hypothetical protein [Burkholderiales bacterium]